MTRLTIANYKLLILFIAVISISSCESDAFFDVHDGDSKLFAFSEFSPDSPIEVKVNTSIGINTEDQFYFPRQDGAKVVLYENGVPMENPGFRYNNSKKAFVSQGSFRPEEGVLYGLEVLLKDGTRNINSIFAETVVPLGESLGSSSVILQSDRNSLFFTTDLKSLRNEYFMIKFELTNTNGDLQKDLIINDLLSKEGVTTFKNNNELLIMKDQMVEDLSIELNSDLSLEDLDLVVELRTITKDAYKYYKSVALQILSQGVSLSEPVINHSNFENGLGLFTGYASRTTSFEINE